MQITHKRQPGMETISLDLPARFTTEVVVEQTMMTMKELQSFKFPFELSGKDLKLIKNKQL